MKVTNKGRKTWLQAWPLAIVLIAPAGALVFASPPSEPADTSIAPGDYNVLLIVLDDLGTEFLSFYPENQGFGCGLPAHPMDCDPVPDPLAALPIPCTPTLEALASGGITFTNSYTNPSCSPTRAAILTGLYGFRTGMGVAIVNNQAGVHQLSHDNLFLPELIRAGLGPLYALGAFGKWHLTDPIGDECHPIDAGFDVFDGNMGNGDQNDPTGPNHFEWNHTVATDPCSATVTTVQTARVLDPCDEMLPLTPSWDATVARKAAQLWIEGLDQNRPFFGYVAFNPPHAKMDFPPICRNSNGKIVNFSPSIRRAINAYQIQAGYRAPQAAGWSDFTLCERRYIRRIFKNAVIEALDYEIGQLVAACPLNTVILVIGDNGSDGNPLCHGKRTMYQPGVRVPLIACGPADLIPSSAMGQNDELVDSVDIWRTVGRLVGIRNGEINRMIRLANSVCDPGQAITDCHDSRSFLNLLCDPTATSNRDFSYTDIFVLNQGDLIEGVVTFHAGQGVNNGWLRMITDGDYKLIRSHLAGVTAEEFLDLNDLTDPDERSPLCVQTTGPVCPGDPCNPEKPCCPPAADCAPGGSYNCPTPLGPLGSQERDAYEGLVAEMNALHP